LASGFAVASADLELRGSGNLLGKEQSGHIQVVGLDIYIELLEQSVRELQGKDALQTLDPEVEIPTFASLPDDYITETEDRLREYQKLSSTHTHSELRALAERWVSTYGDLPDPATHLIWNTECQIWCRILGIQKLHWLKSRVLLMLHKNHALDHKKINRLCNKYPTRIKQKETEIGTELFAHFQKEESEAPFGFLFWLFQELRMCMKNPIH
jgi:transcription-repair coupling factor (superfamily II helicase)